MTAPHPPSAEICVICNQDTEEAVGLNSAYEPVHRSCQKRKTIKDDIIVLLIELVALVALFVLWWFK